MGTGPPTLTVVMHRENLWPMTVGEWPEVEDVWLRSLGDPRSQDSNRV